MGSETKITTRKGIKSRGSRSDKNKQEEGKTHQESN